MGQQVFVATEILSYSLAPWLFPYRSLEMLLEEMGVLFTLEGPEWKI